MIIFKVVQILIFILMLFFLAELKIIVISKVRSK